MNYVSLVVNKIKEGLKNYRYGGNNTAVDAHGNVYRASRLKDSVILMDPKTNVIKKEFNNHSDIGKQLVKFTTVYP